MPERLTPQEATAKARREAEQVRDMVENHAGWRIVHDQIERQKQQVLSRIVKGELCHDEYRSYTGELKGLRAIDTALKRLLGKAQGGPEDV